MNHGRLHILWTSGDPLSAEHMVFMYAVNALKRGWWEEVHIIVWGAAAKLLCDNAAIQRCAADFIENGGTMSACKRCAENLNLLDGLQQIPHLDVYYVGERFTEILQSGEKLITV
jgi:hypothetical protein